MPLQSSPTLTKKSLPAKRSSVGTALRTSRSVSRYNPAQSSPEIALDNSEKVDQPLLLSNPALDSSEKVNQPLMLSDPSQFPPEIALEQSFDDQLSWQTTTSRRSVRASRNVVVAPLSIDVCNDAMINSPPASAVCTSISVDVRRRDHFSQKDSSDIYESERYFVSRY